MKTWLYAVAVAALFQPAGAAEPSATTPDTAPVPGAVLAIMEQVADWQLARLQRPSIDWVDAAAYSGIMALARISPNPRYHDAMVRVGEAHQWRLASRPRKALAPQKPFCSIYDADDHCIAQTYVELYLKDRDPRMIGPLLASFETIVAHPKHESLWFDRTNNPGCRDEWSWCDALFMAPPAWVALAAATGRKEFREFAVERWWKTSDYLYDPAEHLYYRDSTYFEQREPNGQKVFWSRGNGWVLAGLARVLQYLPVEDASRPRFERQFHEMADAVVRRQGDDGLWRTSLLDPQGFPIKETSGSGFFCYALAWGVNHGLLPRDRFRPAILRAWAGLTACVKPDGKLTNVQPQAGSPQVFGPESTEPYGVGAFLLAGSEVYRLVQ